MHKRGQVTVFIILGILIIAVLGIIFYLYGSKVNPQVSPSEFDFSKTEVLKNYMETCIQKAGNEVLNLVGKQGGEINPGFYQYYYGDKISYLCYTTTFSPCYNKKPFLFNYVENEINTYVKQKITSCGNEIKNIVRNKGYNVETGLLEIKTKINPYSTIIQVDYPITVKSNTKQVQLSKFTKTFNIPLGRLIKVAEDVVNGKLNLCKDFFHTKLTN